MVPLIWIENGLPFSTDVRYLCHFRDNCLPGPDKLSPEPPPGMPLRLGLQFPKFVI